MFPFLIKKKDLVDEGNTLTIMYLDISKEFVNDIENYGIGAKEC